jgi:hypothetical protein
MVKSFDVLIFTTAIFIVVLNVAGVFPFSLSLMDSAVVIFLLGVGLSSVLMKPFLKSLQAWGKRL